MVLLPGLKKEVEDGVTERMPGYGGIYMED